MSHNFEQKDLGLSNGIAMMMSDIGVSLNMLLSPKFTEFFGFSNINFLNI